MEIDWNWLIDFVNRYPIIAASASIITIISAIWGMISLVWNLLTRKRWKYQEDRIKELTTENDERRARDVEFHLKEYRRTLPVTDVGLALDTLVSDASKAETAMREMAVEVSSTSVKSLSMMTDEQVWRTLRYARIADALHSDQDSRSLVNIAALMADVTVGGRVEEVENARIVCDLFRKARGAAAEGDLMVRLFGKATVALFSEEDVERALEYAEAALHLARLQAGDNHEVTDLACLMRDLSALANETLTDTFLQNAYAFRIDPGLARSALDSMALDDYVGLDIAEKTRKKKERKDLFEKMYDAGRDTIAEDVHGALSRAGETRAIFRGLEG